MKHIEVIKFYIMLFCASEASPRALFNFGK